MSTERVCFLCVLDGEKADPVPSSGLSTTRTCPRCKVETHDSHGFWYDIRQAECKCSLRTKLVGDGCAVCNPKLAEELAQNQDDSLSDAEILGHFSKYWEHQWKDSQGNYARILQDELVKGVRALLAKVGA